MVTLAVQFTHKVTSRLAGDRSFVRSFGRAWRVDIQEKLVTIWNHITVVRAQQTAHWCRLNQDTDSYTTKTFRGHFIKVIDTFLNNF